MIHVIDNTYIDADPYNIIVGEKFTANEKDKNGNTIQVERLKNQLFFGTVSNALNSIVRDKIREGIQKNKITTLEHILTEYINLNTKVGAKFEEAEKGISIDGIRGLSSR